MDQLSELQKVGERVRKARHALRMTLETLASKSGVSKSVLSQVERGTTNPTLSTLWNIATALSLDPQRLFSGGDVTSEGQSTEDSLIQSLGLPVIEHQRAKYRLVILNGPELAGDSEFYHLILQPGGVLESDPHEHGALEQLTILKGQVEIVCGGETRRVRAPETVIYPGDQPHKISSWGKGVSESLLFVKFK